MVNHDAENYHNKDCAVCCIVSFGETVRYRKLALNVCSDGLLVGLGVTIPENSALYLP